jgi:hypothetical protein
MLVLMASFFTVPAAADAEVQIGDVIGHVYSTDIVADIDGMDIPSYNIGGVTVIEAEALADYGFDVKWNASARAIYVNTLTLPNTPPVVTPKKEKPGKITGSVLYTDIHAWVNGCQTKSYNIGGRTVVPIEELARSTGGDYARVKNYNAELGYSNGGFRAVWNAEKRTISLRCLRPGLTIETSYGAATIESMVSAYSMGPFFGDGGQGSAVIMWQGIDGDDPDSAYFFDMGAVRGMTEASVGVRDETLYIDSARGGREHSIGRPSGYVSIGDNFNPLLRFDAVINGKETDIRALVLGGDLFVNLAPLRDTLNISLI